MAEYKKQAQTAPKQNAQNPQAPVVRAKIERLITDEESKVKAYASVTIGGMFAVHGVRVYQTENGGNYVSMPFNRYARRNHCGFVRTVRGGKADRRGWQGHSERRTA